MVCGDISALSAHSAGSENLSQSQTEALLRLKSYTQLTIKEADKGGCIIVLDNEHYKQSCLDILENQPWYQAIPFEWVDSFTVEFYGLVDEALNNCLINKTLWQFIRTPHLQIFTFYCLPKLHKPGTLRGRPIVSGSCNLTEVASKLIDWTLRPHVETLFSYVKDTLSFSQFMEGSFLVTIDIECLYNCIPHRLGVQTIATYLDQMSLTIYINLL